MVASSGDLLTIHDIVIYGRFPIGRDGEDGTLKYIEVHLPRSDPLVERIQIFVETYVVLWRHYLSIDNTIICEEAHH